MMKNCPVCGAAAFDDAARCFGCMHPFDEGQVPAAPLGRHAVRQAGLPTLVISVDAVRGEGGGLEWRCSVNRARPFEPEIS